MNSPNAPTVSLLISNDKVVSYREAAEISGISISTFKRQAKASELKILRLSPRRVGIRLSALHSWLDTRSA